MNHLKNEIDYFPDNWKPRKDIGIIFDDKTAQSRNKKDVGEMVKRMRELSNEYGFDLNTWDAGHFVGFKKV